MKLVNFFSHVTRSAAAVIVSVLLGVTALSAQQTYRVVSDHSTASLYLGTRDNPTSSNVGIARVSGDAQLNSDDPSASRFNFTIYAAGENPAASNGQAGSGDRTVISFHSKSVKARNDGTLQVRGELTVTRVEREVTAGTGEDYSGPVYGPARLVTTSHDSSFILAAAQVESTPDSGSGDAHLLKVQKEQPGMLIIGTTSVSGEAFPQLARSVQNTVWPIPVNDEQCSTPSAVGEDYSGITCRGEAIAPAPAAVVPSQNGEDYAGVQLVPPAGDQVTIQLKLVLANADRSSTLGQQNLNGIGNTNSQSQAEAQ